MRLSRHATSLVVSHDWSPSLFPSTRGIRLPRFGPAVLLTVFLLPLPAGAQPRDPQRAALDDFIAARLLTAKCPSWQIDEAEARLRFSQLNLLPPDWQEGGRHGSFFSARLSYYRGFISRMSETQACEAAEAAFGPNGAVRKGWMKRQ